MVAETRNCTVTLYSGTTENQFGDVIDSNTPVTEHVPATLVETGHKTQDPSSPTPRTIREITLRLPYWTNATGDMRVLDERTGDVYMIISVTRPPTIIGAPVDLVAQLKRVSANST